MHERDTGCDESKFHSNSHTRDGVFSTTRLQFLSIARASQMESGVLVRTASGRDVNRVLQLQVDHTFTQCHITRIILPQRCDFMMLEYFVRLSVYVEPTLYQNGKILSVRLGNRTWDCD